MARRRKRAEGGALTGNFVVLMASLSIILLSFFILLNSLAILDNTRRRLALGSLAGAFGILPEGLRPDMPAGGKQPGKEREGRYYMPSPPIEDMETSFRKAFKEFAHYLIAAGLSDQVQVKGRKNGLEVSWASDLLFAPGSAEMNPAGYPLLDKLAEMVLASNYDAVIEGHTDNSPVASRAFRSNWELSAARAIGVMRYLVSEHAMPPERLTAAGYAEYRPTVANRTPQHRARNRRVSVLLVKP